MNQNQILIFTDGSSKGNPGPGGWGVIVACPSKDKGADCDQVLELGGREEHTTNNRMEMQAAVQALKSLDSVVGDAIIHTDSSYLVKGITLWVPGWKKNNWQTKAKEPVSNRDLWEALDEVLEKREEFGAVQWKLVEGHVGVPANERVDRIATAFADNRIPDLYNGPRSAYPINLLSLAADGAQKLAKHSKKSRSSGKAYSYISMVNGNIQTHTTWAECEARVKGVKNVRFKKALSPENEKEIIEEFKKS